MTVSFDIGVVSAKTEDPKDVKDLSIRRTGTPAIALLASMKHEQANKIAANLYFEVFLHLIVMYNSGQK